MAITYKVRRALKNARENGYSFEGWSHEAIARDMLDFDSDLESETEESVIEALKKIEQESK